ncbi:MAG: hypothetical protein RIQ54_149 [Candidatus Parcubacteria bacterium]|jgi:hypothetical protein
MNTPSFSSVINRYSLYIAATVVFAILMISFFWFSTALVMEFQRGKLPVAPVDTQPLPQFHLELIEDLNVAGTMLKKN